MEIAGKQSPAMATVNASRHGERGRSMRDESPVDNQSTVSRCSLALPQKFVEAVCQVRQLFRAPRGLLQVDEDLVAPAAWAASR